MLVKSQKRKGNKGLIGKGKKKSLSKEDKIGPLLSPSPDQCYVTTFHRTRDKQLNPLPDTILKFTSVITLFSPTKVERGFTAL